MAVKVEIDDNKLIYFTGDAKDELKNQMERYSTEIIKEAGRLEESLREDNSTPEITRNLIIKAVAKYKNTFSKRKKTKKITFIKITSTISLFIAGALCDIDSFKTNVLLLSLFLLLTLIAAVSTTMMYMSEDE